MKPHLFLLTQPASFLKISVREGIALYNFDCVESGNEPVSDDGENKCIALESSIRENFQGPGYRFHLELWSKAIDRIVIDPDGAITAARTLLETTCNIILQELEISFEPTADLLKRYNLICRSLGMAPAGQIDTSFRAAFSSAYQIVQAVAELRNRFGDAHGKTASSPKAGRAEAELAVHLAGAVSCFLIRRFENHLSATRRLTQSGKAVLRFDKSLVWRLVDHSTNAPASMSYFDEEVGKCLMFVGDSGIYLMSNGDPQILIDGKVWSEGVAEKRPLVAMADGCDDHDDFEAWWPMHNAIAEGSDFAFPIPVDEFRESLEGANNAIVIVAGPESYVILSDSQFEDLDFSDLDADAEKLQAGLDRCDEAEN